MAEFSATISFEVAYRAKDDETFTRERATGLAETMLAVLRGSAKVKALTIEPGDVEGVERIS